MRIASLVLIAGLTLFGCVDDSGSAFYIEGNVEPDEECLYPTGTSEFIPRGVMNIDLAFEYVFAPLYANQLIENSSIAPPRPDPNGLLVRGAEILIMDAAGGTMGFAGLPNPFTVRNTTFVPSSDSPGSPGLAIGLLTIVPAQYVADLAASLPADAISEIQVSVKPFADTLGHGSVEGRDFVWTIALCRGLCLIDTSGTPSGDVCCNIGQDFLSDSACISGP